MLLLWARRVVPFVLAVGVTSGIVTWVAMRQQMKKIRQSWETAQILCASRDLPRGTELAIDDLAVREFPVRFTTDDFIILPANPQPAANFENPIGRRLA